MTLVTFVKAKISRIPWFRRALGPPLRAIRVARYVYQLFRVTPDWMEVWRKRRHPTGRRLPPLRLRNGFVLNHGDLDQPIDMLQEVFIDRWYEPVTDPPEEAAMLDIGANIGAVTLYFASKFPSLRIHAYEPNPSAIESLPKNIEQNGLERRVAVYNEAVGRSRGTLDLWVDIPSALSTGYLAESPVEGGRRISVPMIGLDEVWDRLDRKDIWLLKIDTEGAEADILEGAPPAILRATQSVIVEYHDNISAGVSTRCRRVLETAGFQLQVLVHPWEEGIFYGRR